jgi:hypothetical protein
MHRIQMRPICSSGFPKLHQLSSDSNSKAVPRLSSHSAIPSRFLAFLTSILLALLIGLSITLCGCSGYMSNPAASASPSGSSRTDSPSLTAVYCGTTSLRGPQTQECSVSLNMPAVNSFVVHLSSDNNSLSVPQTVTVSAGSSNASFNAIAAAVAASETVTLTAKAHKLSQTFLMQLSPAQSQVAGASINVSATTLSFGNVLVGNTDSLPLTLTSTGTQSVTISGATLTGTGFSVSGVSFPTTLSPGQTATLAVQFDPSAAGIDTGELSIASSTGPTLVSLTGTGATHEIKLTWDAPNSTSDQIAGYHIYRSPAGTSSYQLLSSSDTQTTYSDLTVQGGQAYDYLVKSVDDAGVESSPSNISDVVVP